MMPRLILHPPNRLTPILTAATLALLILTASSLSAATPTRETPRRPSVYKDSVEPHWFDQNRQFWYRNLLASNRTEFIRVNAITGERKPAFDHTQVAQHLSKQTGTTLHPDRLPIESLFFPTNSTLIHLVGIDQGWAFDPATQALTPLPAGSPGTTTLQPENTERPSTNGGRETEIAFINRTPSILSLHWIDPEGNRQPYGQLQPGQTRKQHTFAGHVWAVTDTNGMLIAAFEGRSARLPAIIDTDTRTKAGPNPNPSSRSRRADREPATVRSPDGRWESFARDHNLWLRNLASREESQLSFDGNPGFTYHRDYSRDRWIGMDYDKPSPPPSLPDVRWSPDSTRLVAMATRTVPERRVPLVESSPRQDLNSRPQSYPYLKPGDEIPTRWPRLFHLESRKPITISTTLFPTPWDIGDAQWTTNSAQFRFLYNQRGHQVLRWIEVDAATGLTRTLIDEQSPTFIDYAGKYFLKQLDSTPELVWMSERDGWNHLYLIDTTAGQVRNRITQGPWAVQRVEHIDETRRELWFHAAGIRPGQDPYHTHLCRIRLDGSQLTLLTEADGTHEIEFSPDRAFLLDRWSRVDQPPITELRRASDGSLVCRLEEADASEVIAQRGRFPERFHAPGRDGTTPIHGIIHWPRTLTPGQSYPILEKIYAGPHGFHVPKAFRAAYREHDLTDAGFVVVQIDGMGTSGRSKAFHDVAWKNLGDAGFPDRIAWLKAAATRYPQLDLNRVGIYGGSAGGQNAMRALIAHGDFYKAAAADCGCHDNRLDKIWWNELWMGWPIGPHYNDHSNVTQAHRLQGHLLLTVGELDKNVDPASTYRVVDALIRANKPFEFLPLPGLGHGAGESDYAARRRQQFFIQHLNPPQPKPHGN